MTQTQKIEKPTLDDVIAIINHLPDNLEHHSSVEIYVVRSALYWGSYPDNDSFDGKAFVESCANGDGTLFSLAEKLDTDLQIFEMNQGQQQNFSNDDLAMAASYGMMAIENATQLFCATCFGQGVYQRTQKLINDFTPDAPFNNLGPEHAAILGAILAAFIKNIPVIVESPYAILIEKIVTAINPAVSNLPIISADCGDIPGQAMIEQALKIQKECYSNS